MVTSFLLFAAIAVAPSVPTNLDIERFRTRHGPTDFAFEVRWENPDETIARAFFKIGSCPTENYDTTGSLSGTAPDTIHVSREGQQLLFVWLEDSKGRTDYRNNASVRLLHPFTFRLFNEMARRSFSVRVALGLGAVLHTGFASLDNRLARSPIEYLHIGFGFGRTSTDLSVQVVLAGMPPGMPYRAPILSQHFGLIQGQIGITHRFEFAAGSFGVAPSFGWCGLRKRGYLETENPVTHEREIEIDEAYVDAGAAVGVKAVKYFVPNITFSGTGQCGINIIGVGLEYHHLFCFEGIDQFGIDLMTARNSERAFRTGSVRLTRYQSKGLDILCVGMMIGVYF